MKVDLKRDWFDPSGSLLRAHSNPHEVPDEWEDKLPETATVLRETDDEKTSKPMAKVDGKTASAPEVPLSNAAVKTK